jgi:hypothetical protein
MIRPATVEDERRAFTNTDPIPFERIDESALAWATDRYAELTGDVDEIAFSDALKCYFAKAEA